MADTNVRERGNAPVGETQPASTAKEAERSSRRAVGSAEESLRRGGQAAEDVSAAAQESSERAGEAARRGVEDVTASLAEQSPKAAGSLKEAIDVHRDTIQSATDDVKAAAMAAGASADGLLTIESAIVEWAGQSVQSAAHASQRILGSRTLRDVADAQHDFLQSMLKSWMEGNVAILRATSELSERALGPLSTRIQQRTLS